MKTLPDNAFDLAVVDPPYGDGQQRERERERDGRPYNRFGGWFERYKTVQPIRGEVREIQGTDENRGNLGGEIRKKIIAWDIAPGKEYFDELFRISRNQIIWGGNYFSLPPTRCFLIWKKLTITENFSMAMAEYAWTSFNTNAKVFDYAPQGQKGETRFHPTQKPVALYKWVYKLFANEGDKIIDTHLGSGSSRIAAYDMNLDFVGCEIDKNYFDKQEERFEKHTSQISLFSEEEYYETL